MNPLVRRLSVIAAGLLAVALACTPASAQQSQTVAGVVVSFGIIPSEVALRADGHRDAHPPNPPVSSQHLLITLDEEKSGKRIGDAEVMIEVTDPHGHVDKKPLLHTQAGGLADYSELFEFYLAGEYSIHVLITPKQGGKPIEARFTFKRAV